MIPGTVLVANKFIPYDTTNRKIYLNDTYTTDNHIIANISNIVAQNHNNVIIDYVNTNYVSANLNKKHKATMFSESDFVLTGIFQVSDLWNPSDESGLVEVVT